MDMETVRFKPDAAMRRRFFVEDSFSHPAKMACGLILEIAARYNIKPGSWVLDPMAGSGTTMLLTLQGIHCCLIELEEHFIRPMLGSWKKMRQHGPMLGCEMGQTMIIRGDARALPLASADCVVSSPPYENIGLSGGDPDKRRERVEAIYGDLNKRRRLLQQKGEDAHYTFHRGNIGQRGYTRPQAIVTSPPYEGSVITEQISDWGAWYKKHGGKGGLVDLAGLHTGYTRPRAIVTSPPYEGSAVGNDAQVAERQWERFQRALETGHVSDSTKQRWRVGQQPAKSHNLVLPRYTRPRVIVTSPPYQDQEPFQDKAFNLHGKGPVQNTRPSATAYTRPQAIVTSPPYGEAQTGGGIAQEGYTKPYRKDKIGGGNLDPVGKRTYMPKNLGGTENIGNLRSNAYWEAMNQVYQECHRVLAPEGVMVLVLKGFTRDGKYIDLPEQTRDLVESLGFKLFDRWQRELWGLSFWRARQKKNNPESWDERLRFEDVMAFRKMTRQ